MLDLVKKGVYIGLGLASLTKEKVETIASEMAKSAKLSETEGRRLAEYLQEEAQKSRESLKHTVEGMVASALTKVPCASKIEELEKRLAALEAALARKDTP